MRRKSAKPLPTSPTLRRMLKLIMRAVGAALGGVFVSALSKAAIPDAGTVASRWAQRTQAAASDYAAGVQNTDKDPTALAIAQGQRYITRVQESFQSGKWANGLRRAGKAGWQQATLAKQGNFSTGVAAAEQKVATAFGPLLAYEQQVQSRIQSMPNTTLADRINRATEWIRQMAAYNPPA
jgi:hypothetical protein